MNKTSSIIISISLIIGLVIVFSGWSKNSTNSSETQIPNVEIIDGVQYITVNAKAGYFPRKSSAQANIPTKLIVSTKNTYDCSLALSIRSINYQKILSNTGEEIIDLGIPTVGQIKGTCSMGMYNFTIDFS